MEKTYTFLCKRSVNEKIAMILCFFNFYPSFVSELKCSDKL